MKDECDMFYCEHLEKLKSERKKHEKEKKKLERERDRDIIALQKGKRDLHIEDYKFHEAYKKDMFKTLNNMFKTLNKILCDECWLSVEKYIRITKLKIKKGAVNERRRDN